jgi:hypothetical protein
MNNCCSHKGFSCQQYSSWFYSENISLLFGNEIKNKDFVLIIINTDMKKYNTSNLYTKQQLMKMLHSVQYMYVNHK